MNFGRGNYMSIKYTVNCWYRLFLLQVTGTFLVLVHVYLRRIQYLRLYLQLYYYAKYTGTFTLVLLYVCLCVCVPYLPVAYMTRNIRAGYSYIRKQVINYYWRQLKFKRSLANFHTTFLLSIPLTFYVSRFCEIFENNKLII